MLHGFHEAEEKWLTGYIDDAVAELRKWNWGDFRGKYRPTLYDICCGNGRCVPFYVNHFENICLHEQNRVFLAGA